MTQTGGVAGGGALTDWISQEVLASSVPRDVIDDAIAAAGTGGRRAGSGDGRDEVFRQLMLARIVEPSVSTAHPRATTSATVISEDKRLSEVQPVRRRQPSRTG